MLESDTEDGVFITKQAALAAVMPINCSWVFLRTPGFDRESQKRSMTFHNRIELFSARVKPRPFKTLHDKALCLDQVKKMVKTKKAVRYTDCTSTMK